MAIEQGENDKTGTSDEFGHKDMLDFSGCAGGVEGLGPGRRVVLWVRGCSLACPGCMTTELWASEASERLVRVADVKAVLSPLLSSADGLTISGGEPMEQAPALTNLVRQLREEHCELEVLVYSGFTLGELQERGNEARSFLKEIDLLIDGRFEQKAENNLKWRGSDNQRIHYLSARAQRHATDDDVQVAERPLQIQMSGGGQFRIIGIPRRGDMARYRALMAERGLRVRKGNDRR